MEEDSRYIYSQSSEALIAKLKEILRIAREIEQLAETRVENSESQSTD